MISMERRPLGERMERAREREFQDGMLGAEPDGRIRGRRQHHMSLDRIT